MNHYGKALSGQTITDI